LLHPLQEQVKVEYGVILKSKSPEFFIPGFLKDISELGALEYRLDELIQSQPSYH